MRIKRNVDANAKNVRKLKYIKIERVNRVGPKNRRRKRAIVAKLESFKAKRRIFSTTRKLRSITVNKNDDLKPKKLETKNIRN